MRCGRSKFSAVPPEISGRLPRREAARVKFTTSSRSMRCSSRGMAKGMLYRDGPVAESESGRGQRYGPMRRASSEGRALGSRPQERLQRAGARLAGSPQSSGTSAWKARSACQAWYIRVDTGTHNASRDRRRCRRIAARRQTLGSWVLLVLQHFRTVQPERALSRSPVRWPSPLPTHIGSGIPSHRSVNQREASEQCTAPRDRTPRVCTAACRVR